MAVTCLTLHSSTYQSTLLLKHRKETIILKSITPLSAQKSGNLPEDFEMSLEFKAICECGDTLPIKERCSKCKAKLGNEVERWKFIEIAVEVNFYLI